MTADPEEDWARLAEQIEQRLDKLGLQWKDIPGRGGPSTAKVRELRNGSSRTLSRSKRRDLERALEWEHGSVDWVLAGRDPHPIPRPSNVASVTAVPLRRLSIAALRQLLVEVSGEIASRIPDDVKDWQDGWRPDGGEDSGVGFDEDGK